MCVYRHSCPFSLPYPQTNPVPSLTASLKACYKTILCQVVVAYDFNPSTQDSLDYTKKPCFEKLKIKTKQNKKLCSAGLFYELQLTWIDARSTQLLEWGVKVCCGSNNMWLAPPAYAWHLVSYGPSMFICPVNEIVSGGSGVYCLLEFCAGIKPSASPMVSNISSSEVHPLALS